MKIGISTACYYPQETEKALAAVVEGGAACTEIFINSFHELTPGYLAQLQAILAGGATRVTSIHPLTSAMEPMLFFSDYPRRMEDGLEIYKLYLQALAQLGGKYLILHGAYQKLTIEHSRYVDSYGRLHQLAKSFGVLLTQENVGPFMSSNPALFRTLRKDIPDAAFTLDLKQCLRSGHSVTEFLDAMGDRLVHLHLSDSTVDGSDCLPVGEGSFDFAALFARLKKQGYQGDGVIELYSNGFTHTSQLWDSVSAIQNYIKLS